MGDATNDELVRKNKVHAAFIWTSIVPEIGLREAYGPGGARPVMPRIECVEVMADLLPMQEGTAAEFARIMQLEFRCCHVPSCDDRATENKAGRVSAFVYCLDHGPENGCSLKEIVECLENCIWVTV